MHIFYPIYCTYSRMLYYYSMKLCNKFASLEIVVLPLTHRNNAKQISIMKSIKQKNGYHLIYNEVPVYGGHYSIVKNCITIKDGLCLDAAIEVFNLLTIQ